MVSSLSLSFQGKNCLYQEGRMRVGINWGTLCLLFLYGIREKGSGEAGGCRNLAVSQICYSCGLGTLWLQTHAQVTVLLATIIPMPEGTCTSLCASCVGKGGAGIEERQVHLQKEFAWSSCHNTYLTFGIPNPWCDQTDSQKE